MLRPIPRRRRQRTALGVIVLIMLAVALPGVATRIGAADRLVPEAAAPERAVGLVLGAGVRTDGTPGSFLQARVDVAARLWHAGKLGKIIVSGSKVPYYDEPQSMRGALIEAGVPESAIVKDPAGFDTYDSCVRARDVFGADDVIVISQSYHLPRAITTCRLVGVDAIGVGDDTMRERRAAAWWNGSLREFAGSWKMLVDVSSYWLASS